MNAALEIAGLTKVFGGVAAVRDVSIVVAEGEVLGVIGPNGAGKSTLFELVSGFIRADSGTVRLFGSRIDGHRASAVARRGLVRTFQKVRPFPDMTCLENVMVGAYLRTRSRAKCEAIAEDALKRVGLSHRRDVRARGLSTGQRKRLEVARAISTGARVLLLDEITGGVDPGGRAELSDLVRTLNADGITILLIEHDMKVVENLASRVVAMQLGQVIKSGGVSEVLADTRVRQAYLGHS